MDGHKKLLVFKYGGNAMLNEDLKREVIKHICALRNEDYRVIIVHGGGPFIKKSLEEAGIRSEFVAGQRVTDSQAIRYVEKALKGEVNGDLVTLANKAGYKAVGLSGKDGMMVTGTKRYYEEDNGDTLRKVDMGRVADVAKVDTRLIRLLLDNEYLPIITCLGSDEKGDTYNINGDMFAGHIAAALEADYYIVMTDVDGLMTDLSKPDSLLRRVNLDKLRELKSDGTIAGGMIPKIESCEKALEQGVSYCMIINGTRPEQISKAVKHQTEGTLISK